MTTVDKKTLSDPSDDEGLNFYFDFTVLSVGSSKFSSTHSFRSTLSRISVFSIPSIHRIVVHSYYEILILLGILIKLICGKRSSFQQLINVPW